MNNFDRGFQLAENVYVFAHQIDDRFYLVTIRKVISSWSYEVEARKVNRTVVNHLNKYQCDVGTKTLDEACEKADEVIQRLEKTFKWYDRAGEV